MGWGEARPGVLRVDAGLRSSLCSLATWATSKSVLRLCTAGTEVLCNRGMSLRSLLSYPSTTPMKGPCDEPVGCDKNPYSGPLKHHPPRQESCNHEMKAMLNG